ncbi:MAG: cytochrome c [Cocleimonas sp.]
MLVKIDTHFKVIAIVLFSMVLSTCTDSERSRENSKKTGSNFSSEGERIYFTGISSSGDAIRPIGGQHHMQMHGGSCATCHGFDKEGGVRMWPRFWVVTPALTLDSLKSDHQSDDHDHPSYDEASLKKAIVDGLRPSGEALHETMPRWRMSEKSLDALVSYLLKKNEKQGH